MAIYGVFLLVAMYNTPKMVYVCSPDVTLHYDIVRVRESLRSYCLEAKFRV